ncbi:MAG: TIGR01212 family radical SAM protein [Porcipelethomonas sp.]
MNCFFIYSDDNKRYHTLAYYNRHKYGCRVYKAVIDAGFTCPNKDGSKGRGGCIFCDGGSGYFTQDACVPVSVQAENEIKRIHSRHPDAYAVAYFQANTNTYADVKTLKKIYSQVLDIPFIKGISIGTRADCLPDDVADYLYELSQKTDLTVELGMQTIHNSTLEFINRGYSHEEFISGYNKLRDRNIRVCLHIINGLPCETHEMMMETAIETGKLCPDAVKIQLLHVIKGTELEKIYNSGQFQTLTKDEYIRLVVNQLEYLPPETVIERITGDGDKNKLAAPLWSTDKISVLGGIDKLQSELDSYQGKRFTFHQE